MDSAGNVYVADTYNHTIRAGGPLLALATVVSRKTHGAAGTFDINLPFNCPYGVECRQGGGPNHDQFTLVFTFSNTLQPNVGTATVTRSSVGTPAAVITGFSANTVTVNLTAAANAQLITVMLSGLMDTFGQTLPDTSVNIVILLGDTTGNGCVNSSDVAQTKFHSGEPVDAHNCREDVTANGNINSADVALVKQNVPNCVTFCPPP